jgi:hypothetical protein
MPLVLISIWWLWTSALILLCITACCLPRMQAPDVMRSCSMALQLASTAIGSYLSGIIVWAVQVRIGPGGGPRAVSGSPDVAGQRHP